MSSQLYVRVDFWTIPGWQLENVLVAAMQVPSFPELPDLRLSSLDPVIPDSFLDGSAPRL
jgi:hypothetical protein